MDPTLPLNALRVFEVAARTGSFTKAAGELGVSSAAVSQQIKRLEDYWRETLFIRQGNRIALTDAGQSAYPQLAEMMTGLAALSDRMRRREQGRERLTLSAPLSVAETWLPARLSPLAGTAAARRLDLRVDDDPVDLVREKIDMRIFLGHDLYGEYRTISLLSDHLIAVASPVFAERHGGRLDTAPDAGFIHTDWGRGFASSPDWATALRDLRPIDPAAGMRVRSSSMALNFARRGFGVALAPEMMAASDLAEGRLAQMEMAPVSLDQDYRIAYPKRLHGDADLQMIVSALRAPSP